MPNVLSPRDLVSRPDIMDETVSYDSQMPHCVCMCARVNVYA